MFHDGGDRRCCEIWTVDQEKITNTDALASRARGATMEIEPAPAHKLVTD
jgi:hypothetical protein